MTQKIDARDARDATLHVLCKERTTPETCSICGRREEFLKLTEGCIWLCRKCRSFLKDLKQK